MKIMTVNSKIKQKCKTMLGMNRNRILDFILYFVTTYMRKYPTHVTSAQGTVQNGAMALWLRCWIPNQWVPCSKQLCGFKVDSAFHSLEVNKMSTRNFWELSSKK